MKKLIASIFVSLMLLAPVAALISHAPEAQAEFNYLETLQDFQEGVEDQSGGDLEAGAEEIVLPDFQDDSSDTGVDGIVNTIKNFLDFFKLFIVPLMLLFMIIMGVKMVASGSDSEETFTKAKSYIKYAAMGMVVILIADQIVDVMYGYEGDIFREGEAGAREYGRKTSELFRGIYSLAQVLIGSVAVFVLVLAGFRYIAGSFSEDQISSAKRQIIWSSVGLFVVAISEFVAKKILFVDQGSSLGVNEAKELFAQVTNFIAGTIGTLSFAMMLYAGYMYVTARDDEEATSKAKKIITGAILGVVLALAAFAITNTLVDLDVSR